MRFITHDAEAFVTACPGAGKTRTIVDRVAGLSPQLLPRKGIGILSFTHSAVDTFKERCRERNLEIILKHPSFIGTFDAFIRHFMVVPGGIDGVDIAPQIIDSWDSLKAEVRLSGSSAFRGEGVSLDRFSPIDNQINPDTIGRAALRQHVVNNQPAYVRAATQYRAALIRRGYLSAADARVRAVKNLENATWAAALGKALKGRFHEIIVDEAQDCNPEDIKLLQWMRNHALRVILVCDPDQAIYEFRQGIPANLQSFSETYTPFNKLELTGNFRSTPPICALAATLRSRAAADTAVGDNAELLHPVQIIPYLGASATEEIGRRFAQHIDGLGTNIDVKERIILSHNYRSAIRASGNTLPNGSGGSRLSTVAENIHKFWSPVSSNRDKEAALRNTEKTILAMMGKIGEDDHPARAAEQHGIEKRELRRKALEFITALPPACAPSEQARTEWLNLLYSAVQHLSIEFPPRQSVRTFFRTPQNHSWAENLQSGAMSGCACSTIHQAKGKQFHAVCLVIPPDRAPDNHTSNLFTVWESRADHEAKRVIYVGATRAEKLLAIAVPQVFQGRLINILNAAGVSHGLI